MLAALFPGPHAGCHIQLTSPSSLLLPIVQSQVRGLELRAAVPSAVHVLDIEHKTLNLWEGQGAHADGPGGWRGREGI